MFSIAPFQDRLDAMNTGRTYEVSPAELKAITANELSAFFVLSPHFCSMLQLNNKD